MSAWLAPVAPAEVVEWGQASLLLSVQTLKEIKPVTLEAYDNAYCG